MKKFYCNLNTTHILKDPRELPICKQIVCNACIEERLDYKQQYVCSICNFVHLKSDIDANKSDLLEKIVIELSEQTCKILDEQFKKLKTKKNEVYLHAHGLKEKFDNYFNFLEYEIDLRFESVNSELKKLGDCGKRNLKLNKIDIQTVEKLIKLGFERSERSVCLKQIGTLSSPFLNLKALTSNCFQKIDLRNHLHSACGLCSLNDEYLLLCDFTGNQIIKFDKSFNRVSDANRLQQHVRVSNYFDVCASNDCSRVYLTDLDLNRVVIVDKQLNTIYGYITKTPFLKEFLEIRDICFYEKRIYLLDQYMRIVFIFESNGEFFKSFDINPKDLTFQDENFNNLPLGITVGNERISILDWKRSIFIYDLNGNNLSIVKQEGATSLTYVNEYLFVHGENGRLVVYSFDDNLIQLDLTYEELKCISENMCIFNDKLVISFGWKKFIGVINLQ